MRQDELRQGESIMTFRSFTTLYYYNHTSWGRFKGLKFQCKHQTRLQVFSTSKCPSILKSCTSWSPRHPEGGSRFGLLGKKSSDPGTAKSLRPADDKVIKNVFVCGQRPKARGLAMRNVMRLKGNKLAAVLRHSFNLSIFLFSSKKSQ